jgi:hypothetical protein
MKSIFRAPRPGAMYLQGPVMLFVDAAPAPVPTGVTQSEKVILELSPYYLVPGEEITIRLTKDGNIEVLAGASPGEDS